MLEVAWDHELGLDAQLAAGVGLVLGRVAQLGHIDQLEAYAMPACRQYMFRGPLSVCGASVWLKGSERAVALSRDRQEVPSRARLCLG